MDWCPGAGKRVEDLPTTAGIYAEIYWPERGVRIGETGLSVRDKIRKDIRWFESMKSRTAPVAQRRGRFRDHGHHSFPWPTSSWDDGILLR